MRAITDNHVAKPLSDPWIKGAKEIQRLMSSASQ